MFSGCVFGDISDDLRASNGKLNVMTERLTTANTLLAQINEQLDSTNTRLAAVETQLEDSTTRLAKLEDRLRALDSMGSSLTSVDESLRTVRVLIEKIPVVGSRVQQSAEQEERDGQ